MSMSNVITCSRWVGRIRLKNIELDGHYVSLPVCLNENHKTSRCQQRKNIARLVMTCNENFSCWQNRQIGASTEHSRQHWNDQESRNPRGGRNNYNLNPSISRDPTPSTSASKNANRNSNNYSVRSGLQPPKRRAIVETSLYVRALCHPIGRIQQTKSPGSCGADPKHKTPPTVGVKSVSGVVKKSATNRETVLLYARKKVWSVNQKDDARFHIIYEEVWTLISVINYTKKEQRR